MTCQASTTFRRDNSTACLPVNPALMHQPLAINVMSKTTAVPHAPVYMSAKTINYGPAQSLQNCTSHAPSLFGTTIHDFRPDNTLYRSSSHRITTPRHILSPYLKQTCPLTPALWHAVTSWAPRPLNPSLYPPPMCPMKPVSPVLVIFLHSLKR